jgi:hypothetical protein
MPPLFLESAHAAAIGLGRTADQDHRPAILLRIGKAGEAVQDAGAGPSVGPLSVAQRLVLHWPTIALPEPVVGWAYCPIRWPTKPIFRLLCRTEQRSLISLLNAAKKQPGVSPSPRNPLLFGRADSEITAKTVADLGCCPL